MNECIRIQEVTKSFQGKKALEQLSCTVQRGEIYGFLGPSGAGKTTTIKLLTGQLHADSGTLTVLNEKVTPGRSDLYSQIGILTDTSGFYEKMTVRENLNLFAAISKTRPQRVEEVLAQLGLAEHQSKKAEKLSRGMKQRMMFARAILHKPALLFLDEPTANLDPSTSEDVHDLIRLLNQDGTTVFLTTHNMEEAEELCDRVAFLNEGHIVESGTPTELKLKYAEAQVELLYQDGTRLTVSKEPEALKQALDHPGTLLTIHSKEPDLKTIFLKLTGRDLR